MNKLQTWGAKFLGIGPTSFEGANDNTGRSFIWMSSLDQRSQVNPYTRRRLLEKYHWLRNNIGLVKRLVAGSARYAIGDGIIPKAMTTDTDWNKAHDDWFMQVSTNPALFDYEGRLDYYRAQKSVAMSTMGEGEVFTNCVDANQLEGDFYLPQFQLLASPRISDASDRTTSTKTFDGLGLNPSSQRVEFYRSVSTDIVTGKTVFQDLPAEHVIHTYDPERLGQLRGIPWLYHGINSLIDIMDLTAMEKQAVKVHSALAATVKNKVGNTASSGLTGQLEALLTKTQLAAAKTADPKARNQLLERIFGGGVVPFLAADEELDLLTSDRPSPVFTGFLDWLVRDIAWGFGVSPEFIWALAGMGGANTRTILSDSQSFFSSISTMVINGWAAPVRERIVAAGMLANQGNPALGLPQCKDPLWRLRVHWQTPPKVTSDPGKDAQSAIDLLDRGLGTWGDWWGGQGESGSQKVLERIREVAQAHIDIETIRKELGAGGTLLTPEKFNYDTVFPRTGGAKPGLPPSKDRNLPPN